MKLLVMAFVAQIGAVAGRRGSGRSVTAYGNRPNIPLRSHLVVKFNFITFCELNLLCGRNAVYSVASLACCGRILRNYAWYKLGQLYQAIAL